MLSSYISSVIELHRLVEPAPGRPSSTAGGPEKIRNLKQKESTALTLRIKTTSPTSTSINPSGRFSQMHKNPSPHQQFLSCAPTQQSSPFFPRTP
ncbi:hypothetical protein H0H93_009013 [Arthromyces matolae]|nr:hypothetical protein H0H93_009013 [Arthromyces matolae]